MKTTLVLLIGLSMLVGCTPKSDAPTPPADSGPSPAPVVAAPGAPAGANQPLTDGRMDKNDNGK